MTVYHFNKAPVLMSLKRLLSVSNDYNTEVVIKARDGKLSLATHTDGMIAIELIDEIYDEPTEVVVNLDKLYTFVFYSPAERISFELAKKSLRVKSGASNGSLPLMTLYLNTTLPDDENSYIGSVSRSAFDDLARVANISDDKTSARPFLNGVYFMITPGDIRAVAANGVAFGYSWAIDEKIITTKKEKLLLPATAVGIAQRYDWQGCQYIKVHRPLREDGGLNMVCFSNEKSYLFMSEMAEKDRFPIQFILDAVPDAVSRNHFAVDSTMFKNYTNAAVKLSTYDDRSITVALLNGKVMVVSGRRLPSEIAENGQDFTGYDGILEASDFGEDFTLCLDANVAKQAIQLLAQVDKGTLRVSLGEKTNLIYFSTPQADALYGVAQMHRQ